jgi:hypothetical protein
MAYDKDRDFKPEQRENRGRTQPSPASPHAPVAPGHWFHEGTTYEIATMPIEIIQVVAERRKKKGLFIHPKVQKRLVEAGITV